MATLITNVNLFDGREFHGPSTVFFSDGVIRFVNTNSASAIPDDKGESVTAIDGSGQTLLPGLIDAHVHADHASAASAFPPFGITTVLDMGTRKTTEELDSLRQRTATAESNNTPLPSFLSSGLFASAPGSRHAMMFRLPDAEQVKSPSEAEPFVQARVADGADYIKLIADVPGFPEETLAALAAAARRHGKLSVAHAASSMAYARAARAGVDVLTHIPTDAVLPDELVAQMAAEGRAVVPTVIMMAGMIPVMQAARPQMTFSVENALASVKKMFDAGIPVALGSDSNDAPGLAVPYGSSLYDELEFMVRAGLTETEALRSGTSVSAGIFGLTDRGVVAEGKRADLILVDGNPLDGIQAMRRLKKVWVAGVEVSQLAV